MKLQLNNHIKILCWYFFRLGAGFWAFSRVLKCSDFGSRFPGIARHHLNSRYWHCPENVSTGGRKMLYCSKKKTIPSEAGKTIPSEENPVAGKTPERVQNTTWQDLVRSSTSLDKILSPLCHDGKSPREPRTWARFVLSIDSSIRNVEAFWAINWSYKNSPWRRSRIGGVEGILVWIPAKLS